MGVGDLCGDLRKGGEGMGMRNEEWVWGIWMIV